MRIPGSRAFQRSLRWLRGRWLGGTVVLGYHRVADGHDPWNLSVSPANFEAQMAVLARLARPIPLPRATDALRRGSPLGRSVVVTFDDGYADNLHAVLPALERAGVPATIFVTTGSPGEEFWWDTLARLAGFGPAAVSLERAWTRSLPDPAPARLQSAGGRDAAIRAVAAALRPRPEAERRRYLETLAGVAADAPPPSHRALTADEIRRLAGHELVEVGSHTVSHTPLTELTPDEQRRELTDSRAYLEAVSGAPVRSLSYPNGACSARTLNTAREVGFVIGCTSVPDLATRRADPLALPRLWVEDWSGPRFSMWIRRWLHD